MINGAVVPDDWETLVTGGLAVSAAYYTVSQMRQIENADRRRHKELVEIETRGDRLRAQRAAYPMADHVLRTVERIEDFSRRDVASDLAAGDLAALQEIDGLVIEVKAIRKQPAFKAVDDLMTKDMAFNSLVFGTQLDFLEALLGAARDGYTQRSYPQPTATQIATTLSDIGSRLRRYSDDLKRLAEEYQSGNFRSLS